MNLYWSVYKNLEKELINLADIIHFDDKQTDVYSIHISDLLIRTAVEIEAISKYLYEKNGGDMTSVDKNGEPRSLFFDSDCIQALDLQWHITKKVVNVVASNFYFEKQENRVLRPLKDCNKQGKGRWKKAYQAVKHNRIKSLSAGNIGNLIRAMAALYILNIYNMDDQITDLDIGDMEMDTSLGSSVFSVNVYKATTINMGEQMSDANISEHLNNTPELSRDATVLIDRYTENSFIEMHKNYIADWTITKKNFEQSDMIRKFLIKHPEYSSRNVVEICIACGEENERIHLGLEDGNNNDISDETKEKIRNAGHRMLRSIISFKHTTQGEKSKREIVLNKLQSIYPTLE